MFILLTDNQSNILCDFEDGSCDSVFLHEMIQTNVRHINSAGKYAYPTSDHTFGQGLMV